MHGFIVPDLIVPEDMYAVVEHYWSWVFAWVSGMNVILPPQSLSHVTQENSIMHRFIAPNLMSEVFNATVNLVCTIM